MTWMELTQRIVASNQISLDEVTVQVRVLAIQGAYLSIKNEVETTFPAFVQLGTSGTISEFVPHGTEYTTSWSYNNQLAEGTEIPQSFSFNQISNYQYSLIVQTS